jgi:hypothetical protein
MEVVLCNVAFHKVFLNALLFFVKFSKNLIEKLNDKNSPKFHESLGELLKKCNSHI